MALSIREAGFADSVLLNRLGYSIYPAYFSHLWLSESEMNDFLDKEYSCSSIESSLKDPGVTWYLAEYGNNIVGFAKVTWESIIPETSISGVLLNKLYLSPNETGKNYGKLMFENSVMQAQHRGKKFLWLEVLEQNERAYLFYEKQGMQYIKDTVFETASQQTTLKIMGMSI